MAKAKFTQDASKRLVNFYLDEADAFRLDILCDERGISRTQFLAGLVATQVADIDLSPEDIAEVNANIQKRLDAGYSKNYRSDKRYRRE